MLIHISSSHAKWMKCLGFISRENYGYQLDLKSLFLLASTQFDSSDNIPPSCVSTAVNRQKHRKRWDEDGQQRDCSGSVNVSHQVALLSLVRGNRAAASVSPVAWTIIPHYRDICKTHIWNNCEIPFKRKTFKFFIIEWKSMKQMIVFKSGWINTFTLKEYLCDVDSLEYIATS